MRLFRVLIARRTSSTLRKTRSTLLRRVTPTSLCAVKPVVLPRKLREETEIKACADNSREASVLMAAAASSRMAAAAEVEEEVTEEEAEVIMVEVIMVEVVGMTETEEEEGVIVIPMATVVEEIAVALVTETETEAVVVATADSVIAVVTVVVTAPVTKESALHSRRVPATAGTLVDSSILKSRSSLRDPFVKRDSTLCIIHPQAHASIPCCVGA